MKEEIAKKETKALWKGKTKMRIDGTRRKKEWTSVQG
jgi:hypothetical protein